MDTLGLQRAVPSVSASTSGDAQRVAFASFALGETGSNRDPKFDVFVRDRRAGTTTTVSVGPHGEPANGTNGDPAMSADGRFVAFDSSASNLVPGGSIHAYGLYVRDLAAGKTERISVPPRRPDGWTIASQPAISSGGRFVAFTLGTSTGSGGTYRYGIYLRDRETGSTRRVSIGFRGGDANGDSSNPAISPHGRFVAFESDARNLVANDKNGKRDVFVRDLKTGRTTLASVSSRGVQGNAVSVAPAVSAGGRFVAFESSAGNLVPNDTNHAVDVFVRDLSTNKTRRVSVNSSGRQAAGDSWLPSISTDGRFVAFLSTASTLVKGDTNGDPDVFVHDLRTGRTRRVSVSSSGAEANGPSSVAGGYDTAPSISAQAQYVAFQSAATNLVPDDTNNQFDVFVRGPLAP